MKVAFEDVASALRYGAPSPEEQQAILALARGDLNQAEAILDQVVAQHPERVRNIRMYREPGVAAGLMFKYVLQVATSAQISQAQNSPRLTAAVSKSMLAPPAYEESESTSGPSVVNRELIGKNDSKLTDVATLRSPSNDETENGVRRRKKN